jgi:nucleoside-diphosphate-sugar epimerase
MAKRMLICGATGFIGKNMLARFYDNSEYDIVATYHNSEPNTDYDVEWLRLDLTNKEDVRAAMVEIDVILQFAATTTGAKDIVSKPYIHVTDNVVMNSLIFREAHNSGVAHIIFPSCTVMYQSSDVPVKEEDFDPRIEPFPKYFGAAWMKVYLEKQAQFYSRFGRTKYTVMRQTNIYGPHDKFDLEKSHVFGATMTKVMSAPDSTAVVVWGTGEEERDLLYVDDLVDFVELALEKQDAHYELANVGLGKAISISDLVKNVVDISERDLDIVYDTTKPTIKTALAVDISHAKKRFGWSPKTSLESGIKKTMAWWKQNVGQQ